LRTAAISGPRSGPLIASRDRKNETGAGVAQARPVIRPVFPRRRTCYVTSLTVGNYVGLPVKKDHQNEIWPSAKGCFAAHSSGLN
jgi:hypothetical protein